MVMQQAAKVGTSCAEVRFHASTLQASKHPSSKKEDACSAFTPRDQWGGETGEPCECEDRKPYSSQWVHWSWIAAGMDACLFKEGGKYRCWPDGESGQSVPSYLKETFTFAR
jgi:hypothetical protein